MPDKKGNYTVYLASPFFNDDQRARVKHLTELLEDILGFVVLSPSRDGTVVRPGDPISKWKKAFEWNVSNVVEADIVVANIDGKDIGTAYEMGIAHMSGTPVVTCTNEGWATNLMLSVANVAHAKSDEDLKLVLARLRTNLELQYAESEMKDLNLEKKRLVSIEAIEATILDLIEEGFLKEDETAELDED